MVISTRQAIRIARETAKDAGYTNAIVTDTTYDENEGTYEVELESGDSIINVTIDEDSGEVLEFTTD